jgi:hypothetical protein
MYSKLDLRAETASLPPIRAVVRSDKHAIISSIAPIDIATRRDRARGVVRRVHGIFSSAKNNQPIPWETEEQRDLMALLELDCSIFSYEVPSERVSFTVNGETLTRIPALGVVTSRGRAVLDTFPERDARSDRRRSLINALTEIYADRGIPYRAFFGNEIRVQPRFRNARWVLASRAYMASMEEEIQVTAALSMGSDHTFNSLKAELPNIEAEGTVCSLAARRQVAIDLSAPRYGEMRLRLAEDVR